MGSQSGGGSAGTPKHESDWHWFPFPEPNRNYLQLLSLTTSQVWRITVQWPLHNVTGGVAQGISTLYIEPASGWLNPWLRGGSKVLLTSHFRSFLHCISTLSFEELLLKDTSTLSPLLPLVVGTQGLVVGQYKNVITVLPAKAIVLRVVGMPDGSIRSTCQTASLFPCECTSLLFGPCSQRSVGPACAWKLPPPMAIGISSGLVLMCNPGTSHHSDRPVSPAASNAVIPITCALSVKVSLTSVTAYDPFQTRFHDALLAAKNVVVLFNAQVLYVATTPDQRVVTELTCATIEDGKIGRGFRVNAPAYVLALGGIETVRLLQLSANLGDNAKGHLGRGFMLHPVFHDIATVSFPVPKVRWKRSTEPKVHGCFCPRPSKNWAP